MPSTVDAPVLFATFARIIVGILFSF